MGTAVTPMATNLRIWIDGELVADHAVSQDECDPIALTVRHHEMVLLAAARGQPCRVELGDRDADVADSHWLN
jgi:hypothetical protein